MGFPRAIIEAGSDATRFHVHTEEGRGRGALSTLLLVPRESDALAGVLRDLHDPAGPADLDARLGHLAAAAPRGTAFLVALDDLVWVYPSSEVRCRRRRDGDVLDLDEPQVLRMRPGDEFEAAAADGAFLGRLRSEALRPVTAEAASLEPGSAPRRIPRIPRIAWRRAGALAGAAVVAILLGRILLVPEPEPKTPRADAHVGPSVETRLVSFLTGSGARPEVSPDSGASAGHATLPANADDSAGQPAVPLPAESPRARDTTQASATEAQSGGAPAPWEFRAGAAITSSPLLEDGRLVFGSRDGKLYCLDAATGDLLWALASGSGIGSSPCVSGPLVYVGNYAGEVLAADLETGQLVWKARTAGRIVSSPCVVDGTVILGSYDRSVHAFDAATGRKRWSAPTGGAVRGSPEPVGHGAIVIGSTDGTVYCLAARDGKTRWKRKAPGAVHAPAAYDAANGRVIVGSRDGSVLALDAETGKVAWTAKVGAEVNARPGFHEDLVLVGTGRGRLFALAKSDGKPRWEAKAARGFDTTPLVVANRVVAPSSDGTVHVLDAATGHVEKQRRLSSEIFTSPAGGEGLVYVGTVRGTLYALGLP